MTGLPSSAGAVAAVLALHLHIPGGVTGTNHAEAALRVPHPVHPRCNAPPYAMLVTRKNEVVQYRTYQEVLTVACWLVWDP
jgi:hypothetical protein